MTGLGEEEILASRRGNAGNPKIDAALRFARLVVQQRGQVTDANVEELADAGHTQGEVAEIIANVALNIFTNYFNHIAGTEVDFPRVEQAA